MNIERKTLLKNMSDPNKNRDSKCIYCGAKAVLSNEDGQYCKDCMQLHLLEKMFVSLTKLQGKRNEL